MIEIVNVVEDFIINHLVWFFLILISPLLLLLLIPIVLAIVMSWILIRWQFTSILTRFRLTKMIRDSEIANLKGRVRTLFKKYCPPFWRFHLRVLVLLSLQMEIFTQFEDLLNILRGFSAKFKLTKPVETVYGHGEQPKIKEGTDFLWNQIKWEELFQEIAKISDYEVICSPQRWHLTWEAYIFHTQSWDIESDRYTVVVDEPQKIEIKAKENTLK